MGVLPSPSSCAFREQEGHLATPFFFPDSLVISQGWGLIDVPLRASNEGSLRPRVARAQKIISLHPLSSSGRIRRDEYENFETLVRVTLHAMFFPGRRHGPLP